jgi:hypothetical protein
VGDEIAAEFILAHLVFRIVADEITNPKDQVAQPFGEYLDVRGFPHAQEGRCDIIVVIDDDRLEEDAAVPIGIHDIVPVFEYVAVTEIGPEPDDRRLEDGFSRRPGLVGVAR